MGFRSFAGKVGKEFRRALFHLAFPAKCLHCHRLLPPESPLLCDGCSSLLQLASLQGRCPACFNEREEASLALCEGCTHYPSPYTQIGAAFDYEGPAASLVKQLKYSQQPYLARGMAAFLFAQFDRLQWPMPDLLIPAPQSLARWLERGYNQSQLLAEEMGKLLGRPIFPALARKSGDPSQAALNFDQRKMLGGERFYVKRLHPIKGKVLLVIDDVMTSGMTLQRCGEALLKESPAALYALTFCKTYTVSG